MKECVVPRWQQLKSQLNNLSEEEFLLALHRDDAAVCIDARTPEEFAVSHIPKSINLNYLSTDLADQLEALDPEKSYYVYCRTSRRSSRICVLLENMGFDKVYHLKEGMKNYDHLIASQTK